MREPHCPDCREKMEEGILLDMGYGAVTQTVWQPGPGKPRKILGMSLGSVEVRKKDIRKVLSFRCRRCGLLRDYAQ